MEPPPGSVPHPIGQGLAVAVLPRPWRARLMGVLAVLMAVVWVAFAAMMVWVGVQNPQSSVQTPLLVLQLLLGAFVAVQLAMIIGQALVMRGPVLVVDDAGIRTRDLVGWVQVPWVTLQQLTVAGGGDVLVLEAPGGVYLNDKRMRRSRHRFKLSGLETQPQHLVTYLQHRRSLAQQLVTR